MTSRNQLIKMRGGNHKSQIIKYLFSNPRLSGLMSSRAAVQLLRFVTACNPVLFVAWRPSNHPSNR